MKKSSIGVFDSGIGGLTVAHAIKKQLPYESITYFGDTQHLPYGEKSAELISKFSKKIVYFLIKKKCKAIVIACNSASSVAFNVVKEIAQDIPVFNVIDPVINEILKNVNNRQIGVIGTKATIRSKIYEKKIKAISNNMKLHSLETPLLAPMIEEGFVNEKISHAVITNYLKNKKLKNIDSLILACTHYPLIYDEINSYYNKNIQIIDSAKIVAKNIAENLKNMNLLTKNKNPEFKFYVSNYTKSFENSAYFFFKENILLEEVNLFV